MNILDNNNETLSDFLLNNSFTQFVKEPTRIIGKYYDKSDKVEFSKTLIDVVIHNQDLVKSASAIDCPFSDHRFIAINLALKPAQLIKKQIIGRNLPKKNTDLIVDKILSSDLDTTDLNITKDQKWLKFKETILNIIDDIAPEKLITIKNDIDFSWVDVELIKAKLSRDHSYAQSIRSKNDNNFNIYSENIKFSQLLNKDKMINCFRESSAKNIKNSKKLVSPNR